MSGISPTRELFGRENRPRRLCAPSLTTADSMSARQTFLDSIELSSVPPAVIVDSPRDSPLQSPALSRKASYVSLAAAAWAPSLNKYTGSNSLGGDEPREDQNTRLRRLSMSEPENDVQELPPVDRGKGAWGFVVAAFILE